MAKLKARGRQEVGRIEYITSTLAFMTDGHILQNTGSGWKQHQKIKPGVDMVAHFGSRNKAHIDLLKSRYWLAEFHRLMHAEFSLENRWKAKEAIKLMPNDPDGVWSELNDGIWGIRVDIETVKKLCYAWRANEAEFKEINASKAAPVLEPA